MCVRLCYAIQLKRRECLDDFFVLDEEPEYPSSELSSHGPAVVGWRSKADSNLSPKEIILRFDKPAAVCRIQVLAHQYLIRE